MDKNLVSDITAWMQTIRKEVEDNPHTEMATAYVLLSRVLSESQDIDRAVKNLKKAVYGDK